jgi:hypothetical protein
MLNTFLEENEADEMIKISNDFKNGKLKSGSEEGQIKRAKYLNYIEKMMDGELFDEINEYIGECYNEKGLT